MVTFFNDHDQVAAEQSKGAVRARSGTRSRHAECPRCAGAHVMTLGIPCIYYGTEQSFDGHGSGDGADRFIREAMFGGEFGSFASRQRHFFNEDTAVYRELAKIIQLRQEDRIYTRGRQFLRPISGDGINFGFPAMIGDQLISIVPWSRLLDDQEVVLAINTDVNQPRTAWVTIDASLHTADDRTDLRLLHRRRANRHRRGDRSQERFERADDAAARWLRDLPVGSLRRRAHKNEVIGAGSAVAAVDDQRVRSRFGHLEVRVLPAQRSKHLLPLR